MQTRVLRYDAALGDWEGPVTLFKPRPGPSSPGWPELAVGGGGHATVRYDFGGESELAYVSTYDPISREWTASRTERRGVPFEAPQADADGNAFVLRPEKRLVVNFGKFVVDRIDGTTGAWSDTGLSFEAGPPDLLVAQDGRVMVSWFTYDDERSSDHAATYSPYTEAWTERALPVADADGHAEYYEGAFGRGALFVWEQESDSEPAVWAKWVE